MMRPRTHEPVPTEEPSDAAEAATLPGRIISPEQYLELLRTLYEEEQRAAVEKDSMWRKAKLTIVVEPDGRMLTATPLPSATSAASRTTPRAASNKTLTPCASTASLTSDDSCVSEQGDEEDPAATTTTVDEETLAQLTQLDERFCDSRVPRVTHILLPPHTPQPAAEEEEEDELDEEDLMDDEVAAARMVLAAGLLFPVIWVVGLVFLLSSKPEVRKLGAISFAGFIAAMFLFVFMSIGSPATGRT